MPENSIFSVKSKAILKLLEEEINVLETMCQNNYLIILTDFCSFFVVFFLCNLYEFICINCTNFLKPSTKSAFFLGYYYRRGKLPATEIMDCKMPVGVINDEIGFVIHTRCSCGTS